MRYAQKNYKPGYLNRAEQGAIHAGLTMRWQRRPDSFAVDLVSEYSLETGKVRTKRLYSTYRYESAVAETEMILAAGGTVRNDPVAVFGPAEDWG